MSLTERRKAAIRLPGASRDYASINALLWPNFEVVGSDHENVYIAGHDNAGWTMDEQLKRLASGLFFGSEIRPL